MKILRRFWWLLPLALVIAVLGFVAAFLLGSAQHTVAETNSVLDMFGTVMTLAAPIAAVLGASIPPKRGKT